MISQNDEKVDITKYNPLLLDSHRNHKKIVGLPKNEQFKSRFKKAYRRGAITIEFKNFTLENQ